MPSPATPELPALLALGYATAAITGRERRLRLHYQQAAEQLSGVYEKMQANFEGMKRAERLSAIGQLSAGLAHEIRNPLASISGAAQPGSHPPPGPTPGNHGQPWSESGNESGC